MANLSFRVLPNVIIEYKFYWILYMLMIDDSKAKMKEYNLSAAIYEGLCNLIKKIEFF